MKKLIALMLVAATAFTTVACSSTSDTTSTTDTTVVETEDGALDIGDGKLVVWTLADDLVMFSEKFMETYTDITVETIVIAPADYPTKIQATILGGAVEPDVIVAEPQMLESMYEAEFFEDLNQAPYNAQDYADLIVDYVWDVGQDSEGIQRAISYQITPAGFFYRRDIALEVLGTDDPDEVSAYFADYETIVETARTMYDAGYRIFASDAETNYFSGDSAWVIDGTLNVDQARYDYMDLCIQLYQEDLTAYASQWAAPWYQAMGGEVPILTAETQWGTDDLDIWDADSFSEATQGSDTTEVFAFGLPAWGTIILSPNVGETAGDWGVAAGPSYGFGGGTFIGISASSERKAVAWEYIKFITLNEETSEWWMVESEGDTVSYLPTLEKYADVENEVYAGQKLYSFWLEQAQGIDYSKVTKYDTAIADAWGTAIIAVKTGEKTKEEAIEGFYAEVASIYPEIEIVK